MAHPARAGSMGSLCISALLLLAYTGAAPARDASHRSRFQRQEEVVIELRVGRLARQTMLALTADGFLLLPAREFFDLIELRATLDSTGRLEALRQPERVRIVIDPAARQAFVQDEPFELTPSEVVWRDGALYVATSVLERLLDIDFVPDWVELNVAITNPDALPVARRIARERARDALGWARTPMADLHFGLQRRTWDGAVLDWSVLFPSGRPVEDARYRLGLGLNVFGGSLEIEAQRDQRTAASWLGVWPEQRWLAQVGVGDVLGTGPRPSSIRGAFVTNSPFVRPAAFGSETLEGRLAPGWEVELYRDGALIDYARTDPHGRYDLVALIQYGPNPLEVQAYGPFGEVQTFHRAVRVDLDRLPGGVFEYGLAAGECVARPCETLGNIDLRYGISRSWTARAGLEAFLRDSLSDLLQPYGVLSGLVRDRWVLRAEALSDGFVGGELFYEPTPDLRVGVGGARFDRDVEAPILTPATWRSEVRGLALWRPIAARRAFFLEAAGRRLRTATSTQSTLRLSVSNQSVGIRWVAGVGRERTEFEEGALSRTFFDLAGSVSLSLPGIPALNGLFLRASAQASEDGGFERAQVVAARYLFLASRIEATVSWQRGVSEPFVSVGLASALGAARSFSTVTRTPGGDWTASNLTEGALIWNSQARRIEVASSRSLRRGGVGGIVFRDANANGRYDPGDEPLPDVVVGVGPYAAVTDDRGRFAVWDLVPFGVETIALDSLTLPNPLWVPSFHLATIVVAPNGYRNMEIAVVEGAEVSGRVAQVTAAGVTGVGGVGLEIRDLRKGRRVSVTTFHDGEFYVIGLPPGEYEVTVPGDVLRALKAEPPAEPVRFSISPGTEVATPDYVEVRLTSPTR